MKSILLSTAAIVGFAGAAAAEITFSGSATLGYNDTQLSDTDTTPDIGSSIDDNFGFYSDLDIIANLSQELDNGLTVAASFDLDDIDANGSASNNGLDYTLSLTADNAGLYFGETNFAAQNHWVAAGDMEADGFSTASGETVLRGDVTYGNVSTSVSYALANNIGTNNASDTLNQLSIGVTADFGNVNVVAAYQAASGEAAGFYDQDAGANNGPATTSNNSNFNDAEVYGLSVGTSFNGADIRLAYATNGTNDSTGLNVSYPIGPVTATAYYVSESSGGDNWGVNVAYSSGPVAVALDFQNDQGTEVWGLEGSYDVGNGMMVYAGVADSGEDYYVGGSYDLGSGASLLVSYAADNNSNEDDDDDNIGAQAYQVGTTVELSFEF